ncbi:hypothetical protein K435DRAFT_575059, partial [Dendrothele bispora CBS 962.96]
LKPVPPTEYDGTLDARVLHRFCQECCDYLDAGKVKPHRQVFTISRFLKGTAWEFYLNTVAGNVYSWNLETFWVELLNYCFPTNYIGKLRKDIDRCYQNSRNVKTYIHELQELFNLVGQNDECTCVTRLWKGFQESIRTELYLAGLHPEISLWEEV